MEVYVKCKNKCQDLLVLRRLQFIGNNLPTCLFYIIYDVIWKRGLPTLLL